MDARYEGLDGEPQLNLSDFPNSKTATFGVLSKLLEWHCDDPVDAREIQRHEAAAIAQGNRNRFIDEPQLALKLYNKICGELG